LVLSRERRRALLAALALFASGCARPGVVGTRTTPRPLPGTDGAMHPLELGEGARVTVLFFFADHCPTQAAHDARLRALFALYHPRGVEFFAIDAENQATLDHDATEAAKRAYPFPILLDAGGRLARTLGAEYATETFVVDARGVVRYHGGIDSDRRVLHADATPFLRDALDDLLDDRTLRRPEGKTLGCALQIW
jgi:peroxiredoxin